VTRWLCGGLALLMVSAAPLPPVNDALIQSDALPAKLSELRLFAGGAPNDGVNPYTLSTPLFSDYAAKDRFLYLPPGTTLAWTGDGLPEFPLGSVLVKSFSYPADMRRPAEDRRLLETRLLLKRASGWVALPYVWDADGVDASLKRAGTRIDVRWTHLDGSTRQISYAVPNANQCKGCHDVAGQLTPIGPKLRNIASGMAHPAPARPLPRWDDASAPLDARARAYLDVNCGHCHNRQGPADTSGLWMDWDQPAGPNLGVYKRPTAAGRGSGQNEFDIDPGHPDRSILIGRMQSLDPGIAMPELGRASVHEEAVSMLSAWITAMPAGEEKTQ
jgi:hypothetical protein